jgi:hypothetical protein
VLGVGTLAHWVGVSNLYHTRGLPNFLAPSFDLRAIVYDTLKNRTLFKNLRLYKQHSHPSIYCGIFYKKSLSLCAKPQSGQYSINMI